MKVSAKILNRPALRQKDETGKQFVLLESMRATVTIAGIERNVEVQAGFDTDFASIPSAAGPLVPKLGNYNSAAILHDYLYRTGEMGKDGADRVFLAAMESDGVPRWRRELMFVAVRYFGWMAWWENRRLST